MSIKERLTKRQYDVLMRRCQGDRNNDIVENLHLSMQTIKNTMLAISGRLSEHNTFSSICMELGKETSRESDAGGVLTE